MTQSSNVVVCTWSEHYSIGNTVAGRQSTNLAPTGTSEDREGIRWEDESILQRFVIRGLRRCQISAAILTDHFQSTPSSLRASCH
jgi:hypothetical protein